MRKVVTDGSYADKPLSRQKHIATAAEESAVLSREGWEREGCTLGVALLSIT